LGRRSHKAIGDIVREDDIQADGEVRVPPSVSGAVSDLCGAGMHRRTLAHDTHSIRREGINSDDVGGKRNNMHEVTLYVWGYDLRHGVGRGERRGTLARSSCR
jgi:hypothetical protein